MLDVAIIGGGLCGLTLARQLKQRQQSFAVFEARAQLGGRIVSQADAGLRHDVGATWYWPHSEPAIAQLIAELKLVDFAQYDSGAVLILKDPDKAPVSSQQGVHDGARRLVNGMSSLIEALTLTLPNDTIHTAHALIAVHDCNDHVELHFVHQQQLIKVQSRRAVLAIPPRLLDEQVTFSPTLTDSLATAMRHTPTWMAAQAKCVLLYDTALWRAQGQSGNAFVEHEQAMCKEVFDACDANGQHPALGGFIALSPLQRREFAQGLPILLDSQMRQLFGIELQERNQLLQDWANEPYTCSFLDAQQANMDAELAAQADNEKPIPTPPVFGAPALQLGYWQDKLYFGGTETAPGSGHMDGAVRAAQRLAAQLKPVIDTNTQATPRDPTQASADELNDSSLQRFQRWAQRQSEPTFAIYRQRVVYSLAAQQHDQLTQRAVIHAMETLFADALVQLQQLPFDLGHLSIERNRSALTPHIQACFTDHMQTLLDAVIEFNRTSCALSNFPDEHQLAPEYFQTILRDLAAVWHEFSVSANTLLLTYHQQAVHAPSHLPRYPHRAINHLPVR